MSGSTAIQGDAKSRRDLLKTIETTTTLLQNFLSNLKTGEQFDSANVPKDAPDPLDVLHTSATLLKAHTTKLSLLIISKPFTPSAIRKVISEITGTCLPAMMSAVEICSPEKFGRLLHEEVKYVVRTVFCELFQIMEKLQNYLNEVTGSDDRSRDSLVSTGVLWGACDELIELRREGWPGLVVKKARVLKDTLEDELRELQEWGTPDEDEDEDDDQDNDEYEHSNGDKDSLNSVERMFEEPEKIPKDRPDLRQTLDSSLSKLKLVKSMYDAVIKHRFKVLRDKPGDINGTGESNKSSSSSQQTFTQRVDGAMDILRQIPDEVAELVGCLYEHDNEEAQGSLRKISDTSKKVVELLDVTWTNTPDGFPKFAAVWLKLIDQT